MDDDEITLPTWGIFGRVQVSRIAYRKMIALEQGQWYDTPALFFTTSTGTSPTNESEMNTQSQQLELHRITLSMLPSKETYLNIRDFLTLKVSPNQPLPPRAIPPAKDQTFGQLLLPAMMGLIVFTVCVCPIDMKLYCIMLGACLSFSALYFPIPVITKRVSLERRAENAAIVFLFGVSAVSFAFGQKFIPELPEPLVIGAPIAAMIVALIGFSYLRGFLKRIMKE
jgi:hypothetical protein